MKNNIGIIGLGAIGSVISKSLLSNANNNLKYFTRTSKENIKIEFNSQQISIPIECNVIEEQNSNFDWIIICLKAHQIQSATALLKSLIGENTKVVIIRNGINLEDDLLPYTSPKNILPCIIDCPVQPKENNVYWQLKHPIITTIISPLPIAFTTLFDPIDITIIQVKDFKTATWKKLIESAALGSILCTTSKTCQVFSDPKMFDNYRQLVKEGIAVALADGANIETNFLEELILKLKQYPDDKGSSMLTDRLLCKRIELEAKNGAIQKMAKKYGVETPVNDLYCEWIVRINSQRHNI